MPEKILTISKALENPERRKIVLYLFTKQGITFHRLSKELGISLGNLYNHLIILSRVGLIKIDKINGKSFVYLNDKLLVNGNSSNLLL